MAAVKSREDKRWMMFQENMDLLVARLKGIEMIQHQIAVNLELSSKVIQQTAADQLLFSKQIEGDLGLHALNASFCDKSYGCVCGICGSSYDGSGDLFDDDPVFNEGPIFDDKSSINIEPDNFNSMALFNCSMNYPNDVCDVVASSAIDNGPVFDKEFINEWTVFDEESIEVLHDTIGASAPITTAYNTLAATFCSLGKDRSSAGRDNFHHAMRTMPFPKFSGSESTIWIENCLDYFVVFKVPEIMWVIAASLHMEGDAARWFQAYKITEGLGNWNQFVQAVITKFGTDEYPQALFSRLPERMVMLGKTMAPTSSPNLELMSGGILLRSPAMVASSQVFVAGSDQCRKHQVFDGLSTSFPDQELRTAVVVEGAAVRVFDEKPLKDVIWDDEIQLKLQQHLACDRKNLDGFVQRDGDEIFEKMPSMDVAWDEEVSGDSDVYLSSLEHLVEYAQPLCDKDLQPLIVLGIADKSTHVEQFTGDPLVPTETERELPNEAMTENMLPNCGTHVGLLQQLATGAAYLCDEDIKPIAKLNVDAKQSQVSDIHLLHMDVVSDVLGMPLEEVVANSKEFMISGLWNTAARCGFNENLEQTLLTNAHNDIVQRLAMGMNYLVGEKLCHADGSFIYIVQGEDVTEQIFLPQGQCNYLSKVTHASFEKQVWRHNNFSSGQYNDKSKLDSKANFFIRNWDPGLHTLVSILMVMGLQLKPYKRKIWDPGILNLVAANIYEISSSVLFIQSSVMLLLHILDRQ